jgi:hypothetical protein
MTQHTAHNNKMKIRAQHNNSHDTYSLSVLNKAAGVTRKMVPIYQIYGTYLSNFYNIAKAEYYNPDTLAILCCPWLEPEQHSQYRILTTLWAS